MHFIFLALVTFIITIDNALLCGVLLHNKSKKLQRSSAIVVATTLGTTQGLMAMGIGVLMVNEVFRILCVVVLIWMCYKTIGEHSVRKELTTLRTAASVLILTVFGSIGNLIWLGTVHKGDYKTVILLSICSIPLFVVFSLFFAEQTAKSNWFLYMGALLMAWIAASLCIQTTIGRAMTATVPPLIVQVLFTSLIMLIAITASKDKDLD